jgi:hypothetical protein
MDLIDKLKDLLKQATTEQSHYYVASCCREAIAEIECLRAQRDLAEDAIGEYCDTERQSDRGVIEVGRLSLARRIRREADVKVQKSRNKRTSLESSENEK